MNNGIIIEKSKKENTIDVISQIGGFLTSKAREEQYLDFINESKSYKKPIFTVIQDQFKEEYYEYGEILKGEKFLNIEEAINKFDTYEDYYSFWETYVTKMGEMWIKESKCKTQAELDKKTNAVLEWGYNFLNYCSVAYSLISEKKLLLHLDSSSFDFNNIPDITSKYNPINLFDDIEDMDFRLGFYLNNNKYSDITIQIVSPMVQYSVNGKPITAIKVVIVKGYKIIARFLYAKEYPNFIFVVSNHNEQSLLALACGGNCEKCPKVKMNIQQLINNNTDVADFNEDMCKVSAKKISLDHCFISRMDPFKILSLCTYAWTMYKNRKNINRKNSPTKKAYESSNIKISVAENPLNTEVKEIKDKKESLHIVDITKHYVYEKKAWQGGHHDFHKSPVEHERRGHQRIYRNKDGSIRKVVEVKSSIINKGKKGTSRTVYKTKLPE